MKQQEDGDPKIQRDGWDAEQLAEEGSNSDFDGIIRQILRGDESKNDPDERDIAGAPKSEDTPHGREETKND